MRQALDKLFEYRTKYKMKTPAPDSDVFKGWTGWCYLEIIYMLPEVKIIARLLNLLYLKRPMSIKKQLQTS